MEIQKCRGKRCGKASMTYEVIGEDLWSGVPINTEIINDGWGRICVCKSCGDHYDTFDPHMVRIIEPKDN